MKKIAYIISILFLMGLGSCYKDLGNYTYGDKPGIGLDSVLAEYDKYVVIDTLCNNSPGRRDGSNSPL